MNSKLSVRKIEKHEIQILDCDGELKDNENWTSAETSRVRGVARGQKDMAVTSAQSFEGQGGKFKPYTPFNRKPVELFKKFT